MKRTTRKGIDAAGATVEVVVLVPESAEDVAELARMARSGELDDRHSFADDAEPAEAGKRAREQAGTAAKP